MLLPLTLGAAILAALPAWAARRWSRATALAVAELGRAPAPAAPPAGETAAGLPEPVKRYFDFAIGASAGRPILGARIEQEGDFAIRPEAWKRFKAVQHYRLAPPGFVWDARIAFAPLLSARVRDSYAGGRGQMRASLLGLLTMAELDGGGELAIASLQRFLAELPWLPPALLPAAGVSWTPIDSRRAQATLRDGEITATVDFQFGDRGEIEKVAALRSRATRGRMEPTPWEGRFWDYREVEGLQLPHQAEVAWLLPAGRHAYWRARILRFELYRG